jgi:hypothetical protein
MTFSLPKYNGHYFLSTFLLIRFYLDTAANNHAIPVLSLLLQHSVYDLLPHIKFKSLYSAEELFSYIFHAYSVFPNPYIFFYKVA